MVTSRYSKARRMPRVIVALLGAVRGELAAAAVWSIAAGVLVVWGVWRLRSARS